ncbi:hypothetical protein ACFOWE_05995, partial [Planomonospora corallina]
MADETSGTVLRNRLICPQASLALVAIGYAAAQFLLLTPDMGLGHDEAVYASQFSNNDKPAAYHASRGWGTPLLIAPVVMVTDSIVVLRGYLTVVSALLLFGAFRIWFPVRPGYTVPAAAALFAGCWTTVLYGHAVMPNLYTAFGAVALTGLALRVALVDKPVRKADLVMTAIVAAVLPLFRPSDAMVITVSIAGAMAVLLFSSRRRAVLRGLLALSVGSAAGFGQWTLEAMSRFDNPIKRLEAATKSFGTPQWLVEHHVRALDGPTACGTAQSACGVVPAGGVIWLMIAALLVAVGVLATWRSGRAVILVPLVVGCGIAVAYLYYPGMIAPRYLLPGWGLWAIPAGEGVVRLATAFQQRIRLAYAVACVCLLLGGHLYLNHGYTVLNDRFLDLSTRHVKVLAKKIRKLGFRKPCVIYGWRAVQLAHHLDCDPGASFSGLPLPPVTPKPVLAKMKAGYHVIAIYRGDSDRYVTDITSWPEY